MYNVKILLINKEEQIFLLDWKLFESIHKYFVKYAFVFVHILFYLFTKYSYTFKKKCMNLYLNTLKSILYKTVIPNTYTC